MKKVILLNTTVLGPEKSTSGIDLETTLAIGWTGKEKYMTKQKDEHGSKEKAVQTKYST